MNSMVASTFKGRPAFVAVGIVALAFGALAFLIVRGVSGGGGAAVADIGPNPPENPSVSGLWADFAGSVLHWQNYNYSMQPGSPDSANGEEIRGDIWVQVGADNKPTALRGTFTRADGSFHQDYLYANGRAIVVSDQPIKSPGGDSGLPICRQDATLDGETFRSLVDTGEPAFVDYTRVASAGFSRAATAPAEVPPLQASEFGGAPHKVLVGSAGSDEVWSRQSVLETGATLIHSLQVAGDGRIVAETNIERGPDGSEVITQRRASTQIEIFAEQDLAVQSVFDPKTLSEGCGA